jgi:hypothetical protein
VVKQLNETFGDDVFADLQEVKGDRTWREAIVEEFGVNQ